MVSSSHNNVNLLRSYRVPKPEKATFSNCFHSVKWITRNGVVSLSINPKSYIATVNIGNDRAEYVRYLRAKYAWRIIVNKYSRDRRWKNTKMMEKQYWCHVGYGAIKTPWNLEPHRTKMNSITCN